MRRATGLSLVAVCGATLALSAATPDRLRSDVQLSSRADLAQAVPGRVAGAHALGAVGGDTTLSSMSLVLAPSAAQGAALDQLLLDQQNPASASYHKWLTPAQFGSRFGVSDADLAVLESWLTAQGLQVLSVPASRNRIEFTGTAANTEAAFHAGLQKFQQNGQTFISNTAAPSVPAAFSGVVGGVQGLNTYRPVAHIRQRALTTAELGSLHRDLTLTTTTGTVVHELVPYDVRQIYGANTLVSSGYTGTGVTIGVIGQTAVSTAQLGYFQTLTGQTVTAPTLTLVPNTGTSTTYSGDEFEAESDIEYASGLAPGATLNYIYTGNGTSDGVFTSLIYGITSNIGSILTLSYGSCELYSASYTATLEPYLRQASAQGQTVVNSSGDSGAAACDSDAYPTSYDGISASYPASSPNVVGVGGTRLNEGTGTYWSTTNNSQNGSALSYIPEVAWNDSDSTGLSSTGGGASVLFSKPAWQTGTGVPTDNVRHVPDISFAASANHDPYFLCSADTSASSTSGGTTRTAACTSTAGGYYVVGGTSLSAPSFAGMLALVEQANGGTRLGNINASLYSLASSKPAVFNDVTSGNNQVPCISGIPGCANSVLGYTTNTGYDQVTGLGSVNIATLSSAITAVATVSAKTPTVTIAQSSLNTATAIFAISVASVSGSALPTGTVSVSVDGGTATTLTLSSGAVSDTVAISAFTAGAHTIAATYSGDGNYTTAKSTFTFTTGNTVGSFAVSVNPTTLTLANGGSATATITLTSTGYAGLVYYTLTPATGSATAPGCFTGANGDYTSAGTNGSSVALDTGIVAGGTVSGTIKYHAVTTGCSTLSQLSVPLHGIVTASTRTSGSGLPWAAFAFGGFVLGGLGLRRKGAGLLSTGLLALAFTVAALGVSGCGNGGSPLSTTTTTTTGTGTSVTYNYVVTAISYPAKTTTGTANLAITVTN